ncbi:MAG: hypothetical protein BRD46_01925 [Bacteroidetes bacterium QS_8_68_15]|nr:MAG: hypothetical protein BRD46_01925 [Bacteroidetes bacterium QS_8_68_15]
MRLRVFAVLTALVSVLLADAVRAQPTTPSSASGRAETTVRTDTGRAPLPATARAAVLDPLLPISAPVPERPRLPVSPPPRTQTDLSLLEAAPSYHPQRFWYGVGGAGVLDAVFSVGLASIWYDEAERTGFHFYNQSESATGGGTVDDGWLDDWHTFVQQDKMGHVWTSWHVTHIAGGYGRWAGLSPGESALFGGIVSTVFQTQIEISDGFSKAYGFSRTDALANLVGSAAGGLQVAYPERMDWVAAKYSYNPSPYYGTQTTGVDGGGPLGYLGNAIKDYDGITYWLTVRPEELLQGRARRLWPDWLAFSAGYGGDGLAHARSGLSYDDSPPDDDRPAGYAPYEHRRAFYLSPDIDLLHSLDLPQPFQAIARFFEFVRLPAPALQLAPEVRWRWVFY